MTAEPGAGKTTRVPPALMRRGPVLLLQPRRVAARAIARRIAEEQGLRLGADVGWQVRFERRFEAGTRLLVATEGILVARLLADPLLAGWSTVILDEFHERSIHSDLALALVREAARARGDLAIVVMSATLDPEPVAAYLGQCPVLRVPGRAHPVAIEYSPAPPAAAVRASLARPGGHVLCFLPGAGEIARLAGELRDVEGPVLPLHGSLDAAAQDRALAPCPGRKVVLATNVAETSLTVDGVTDVVDTGLHKLLRHDAARGLDRLVQERISQDSADQRAGRAGRTAPGRAVRTWHANERLAPQREPEIRRIDLAAPLLDVLAWGGSARGFPWFEAPPEESIALALALLERLGAVTADGHITAAGRVLRRLPVHPRLARVLMDSGGGPRAAAACALLSEGAFPGAAAVTTDSDVLSLVDRIGEAPGHLRHLARELHVATRRALPDVPVDDADTTLRRALLAGYADRVARRRLPGSPRLVLLSGHGATLGRESGVREAEFLVALDLLAGRPGPGSEARIRVASAVEQDWLQATSIVVEHRFDREAGVVRAVRSERLGALVLSESGIPPEAEEATRVLVQEWQARGLDEASLGLLRRAAFAGLELDTAALMQAACLGRASLPPGGITGAVDRRTLAQLDALAPLTLRVPSGRDARVDYLEGGGASLSVKIQELFGLAATPVLGPRRVPVTLHLLAPNGRPVQVTQDLASFWRTTYAEVRRELRGRYPRHPWPEDPWSAPPTARAKPRQR